MKMRKFGSQRLEVPAPGPGCMGKEIVVLTGEDQARIDRVLPPGAANGTRYPAAQMAALGR